jgi:hypothetical protein
VRTDPYFLFRHAIRFAGYPPLTVAGRILDREGWDDVDNRAVPWEKRAILRRLVNPLTVKATPEARANTRRWFDAGRPVPPPGAGADIVVGDIEGAAVFAVACDMVPAAVAWYAITYLRVFAAGYSSRGWTGNAPPWRPLVTQLAGSADLDTALHELGHAWAHFNPDAPPAEIPTAAQWAAADAIIQARHPDLEELALDRERLADCLAEAWRAGGRTR